MEAKWYGDVNLWIKRGVFHTIPTMNETTDNGWYLEYQLECFNQQNFAKGCHHTEFSVTL